MFYDKFKHLCDLHGISCNKAALEMGLSNATPTKWKKSNATPDGTTLKKISDYFGVTIAYLLEQEDEIFYPDDVSAKMCEDISLLLQEKPSLDRRFFIPFELKKQIKDGTFRFSNVTFPQFSDVLEKSASDYMESKNVNLEGASPSNSDIIAAFFEGTEGLTEEEMEEMWNDARDYLQYKLAQKRRKNNG